MSATINADLLPVDNFLQWHHTQARLDALQHFLALAHRGALQGSSGGEHRAANLADAIAERVPGMDAKAVTGAIEFVRLAAVKPTTARDLLQCSSP